MFDFDTVVVGAGPAGTKCALELASGGQKVAIIEKKAIGGTCLNVGCIPSKSYLYAAEILDNIKKARLHGIETGETSIDWQAMKKRKDKNVKILGMALTKALNEKEVEIIQGEAKVTGANELQVSDRKVTAENIVLALGTSPLFIPIMQKGEHVISSTEALDLEEIPETMAIIGGGVIGVEMASIFSKLGTKVTIIERLPKLLATQDQDLVEVLKKSLEKSGCKIHLETEVTQAKDDGDKAIVSFNGEGHEFDKALVVIGRKANYDLDQLAEVGIENDGRFVTVNENFQTSVPSIYMIGDSAFRRLTAYDAEAEALFIAEKILGKEAQLIETPVVTVFSHPELASVGITDAEGHEVKTSTYAANAKAMIMGSREGMVKIIHEKDEGKVLGVHIVGNHAADLIHQAIPIVTKGMTLKEWKHMMWSHPVLSEVFKSAIES